MNHEEFETRLLDFMEGSLPPTEANAVERHLEHCAECRQALAQARAGHMRCSALAPVPAPDLSTAIMTRVLAQTPHTNSAVTGTTVMEAANIAATPDNTAPGLVAQFFRHFQRNRTALTLAFSVMFIVVAWLCWSPTDPSLRRAVQHSPTLERQAATLSFQPTEIRAWVDPPGATPCMVPCFMGVGPHVTSPQTTVTYQLGATDLVTLLPNSQFAVDSDHLAVAAGEAWCSLSRPADAPGWRMLCDAIVVQARQANFGFKFTPPGVVAIYLSNGLLEITAEASGSTRLFDASTEPVLLKIADGAITAEPWPEEYRHPEHLTSRLPQQQQHPENTDLSQQHDPEPKAPVAPNTAPFATETLSLASMSISTDFASETCAIASDGSAVARPLTVDETAGNTQISTLTLSSASSSITVVSSEDAETPGTTADSSYVSNNQPPETEARLASPTSDAVPLHAPNDPLDALLHHDPSLH